MSDSDAIASLGLLLSFFAFIISLRSYSVAKKSLSISEQQHNERMLGVHVYYIDSFKWKKENNTYISFSMRFSNKGTLSNTISKIELHIEYHDKNNIIGKVKIQPEALITPINLRSHSEILKHPLILDEKSAKSGWVTFKLPQYLNKQLTIDLYKVVAESIDNEIISFDTHIVNEV